MEHIPLYRQSEIYARQGVELSRNTMVRWVSEMARQTPSSVYSAE
ncbi:putative transposase [Shigella flexneri K-404]|nr:putative transposase [Shigella flexneri K-404]